MLKSRSKADERNKNPMRAGQSGLGLDAQRKAVIDYLDRGKWTLLDQFIEVETAASAKSKAGAR
jgi:hypothetical protein